MSAHQPVHRPAGDGSLSLFLGLYLLILAFFILLVSLSTIEERKARAVMDSLSATFAGTERPAGSIGGIREGDRLLLTQQELIGAFSALVRVVEVDVVKPGQLMRIGLPEAVVFEPGTVGPRAALTPIVDRVVAALSSPPAGLRIETELMIERGNTREARMLAAARADALVRGLIARGAPPARVSIALAKGAQARVWLTFRIDDERPTSANGAWF